MSKISISHSHSFALFLHKSSTLTCPIQMILSTLKKGSLVSFSFRTFSKIISAFWPYFSGPFRCDTLPYRGWKGTARWSRMILKETETEKFFWVKWRLCVRAFRVFPKKKSFHTFFSSRLALSCGLSTLSQRKRNLSVSNFRNLNGERANERQTTITFVFTFLDFSHHHHFLLVECEEKSIFSHSTVMMVMMWWRWQC